MYDIACGVNRLRDKEGVGHGHVFLPAVTTEQAHTAVRVMGLVADFPLTRLYEVERSETP